MSKAPRIWHGAVAISSAPCDGCGKHASVLFQLEHSWECRACVLGQERDIRAIDRRGDTLRTVEQIAHEMDLRTAIFLSLESREHSSELPDSPSLPADYVHVLTVLDELRRADDDSGSAIAELRERYEMAGCFSPKQMLLIQWRLTKCGIEHEPLCFAVSVRSDKEIAHIRSFDDWRKKKIAPYLSWEQRSKFGF